MLTVKQQNEKQEKLKKIIVKRIDAFKDYYGREMTNEEIIKFEAWMYHLSHGMGLVIEFLRRDEETIKI